MNDASPPTLHHLAVCNHVTAIWCQCETCWHEATIDIEGLIKRYGADTSFPAVRSKLSCGKCWSRAIYARPNWPSTTGRFGGYPAE